MEELYNSALSQSVYASPPSYTTFPSMIVYKICVSTANGFTPVNTKSASLPASIHQTRSFAALIVIAYTASNSLNPLNTDLPAQSAR